MKDFLVIFIPSVISIFGFILTYRGLNRSFKYEIIKEKHSVNLTKLVEVLTTVMRILSKDKKGNIDLKKMQKNISEVQETVYSYGSIEAIQIISSMMEHLYRIPENKESEEYENNSQKNLCYVALLYSQIKFDISGEEINPIYWFKLKITDYKEYIKQYKKYTNEIIEECKLSTNFKIK